MKVKHMIFSDCFTALRTCRWSLAISLLFGYLFFYLLRINLSVAIVCMVQAPQKQELNNSLDAGYSNVSVDTGDTCGEIETRSTVSSEEFVWSKAMQGYVLSSFYYGYIVTQIPGGWLAGKIGGKHVYGVGVLIGAITTLLTPVAARWTPIALIVLRVIHGLANGAGFPASHHLWGRWAPPLERSKLIPFSYAGTMLGTVLSMAVSGVLCETGVDNGWPLIFYIYGGCAVVWWIIWNLVVFNSPAEHPRITTEEKEYIENSIGHSVYEKNLVIPWKSILRSRAVWAIVVAHFCNNWGSYTILSSVPTYMREVLQFDIKANGFLSALPYLTMYIATNFLGHLADIIRSNNILSTTAVRKVWQFLSLFVPAIFVIATGYMKCEQRWLAVGFLTLAVTFTSFGRSGYSINHVDIAPKYSGVLFGLSNTAATIPGMIAPYVAAAFTPNGTRGEWQTVFFICGVIYAFGAVFYVIFASGEERAWAKSVPKAIETIVDVDDGIKTKQNIEKTEFLLGKEDFPH